MLKCFFITDENLITLISKELNQIDDNECKLVDTRDILTCWSFLLESYKVTDTNFLMKFYETMNEFDHTVFSMTEKQIFHMFIKSLHKKIFPKSSEDENKLELELKEHFEIGTETLLRLLINIDQTVLMLKPELVNEIRHLDSKLCDYLIKLVQSPVSDIFNKKKYKSLTFRQKGLAHVYQVILSRLFGEDYVSIIHILPHFQVSTLGIKNIIQKTQ